MTHGTSSNDLGQIGRTILDSIADLFAEPEFDDDAGSIKLLDRDDTCVWLGLFPTDDEGEPTSDKPAVVWTIEVSRERKGE